MLLLSYSSFFKEGDQTVRDQEMCVLKHTAGLWQSQKVHTDILERIRITSFAVAERELVGDEKLMSR